MAKTMPAAGHMCSQARCAFLAILAAASSAGDSPTSNDSYGRRSAEPRKMASHSREQKAFSIGISLTQQGSLLPNGIPCHWCQEAEDGLDFFRGYVNNAPAGSFLTSDGKRIVVKLEKRFNDGNPQKVYDDYEELALINRQLDPNNIGDTKPIYVFFGPCWSGFNHIAARAAARNDALLITWAFYDWNYFTHPGPVMSPPDFSTGRLRAAYEQLGGNCVGQQSGQPVNDGCAMMNHWSTSHSTHSRRLSYDKSQETNPDGTIWDDGYTNLLDINVPRSTWAFDAIQRVYQAGARKFVFIYQPDAETGASWWRQCSGLQEYTYANFPGVEANLFEIYPEGATPRERKNAFASQINLLNGDEHEVLVVCGDYWRNVLFLTGIKLFTVREKAVIFDTPMDSFFVSAVKGFNANYFLDTLPMTYNKTQTCSLFGDLQAFTSKMQTYLTGMGRSQQTVGYAGMQVAAAGALLVDAFRNLARDRLETQAILANRTLTTEAIIEYLKASTVVTFWGDMRFERSGKRIARALTRQFLPVPPDLRGAHGYTMEQRYILSRIKIVNENASLHCNVRILDTESKDHIVFISAQATRAMQMQATYENCDSSPLEYPSLSWEDKELQTYPCTPGCVYLDHECFACPRGKFRSAQELVCQDCPPGTYASVNGLSACYNCPEHGDCTVRDMQPQPQVGYYPIPVKGNVSLERDAITAASTESDQICVEPYGVPNMISKFRPCLGTVCSGQNGLMLTGYEYLPLSELNSTCAGTNEGVLCGQCVPGHSYYGFRSGLRVCQPCHSKLRLVITAICIVLLFTLVLLYLSAAAASSATKVSSLACPLLRFAVHHWQLAGFLFEATQIDNDEVISYWIVPFDVLLRPFDIAQVQCFRDNCDSFTGTQDLVYVALLAVPSSAAAILLWHAVQTLMRGMKHCTRGMQRMCEGKLCGKLCGICSSKGDDDDDDEDGNDSKGGKGGKDDKKKSTVDTAENTSPAPDSPDKDVVVVAQQKTGEKEFSVMYGPGKSFATMHEGFLMQDSLATIFREMLCMLFLLYPVVLRCTFQATSCMQFSPDNKAEDRLVVNFDIVCDSPAHQELLAGVSGVQWVFGLGLPCALLVFDLFAQEHLFGLRFRQMFTLFYSGYKPDFFFWQVVVFLRMLLVFFIAGQVTNVLYRSLAMSVLFIISLLVDVALHPHDKNDRKVLHTLDKRFHVVLILTCWVGFTVKADTGDQTLTDLQGSISITFKRTLMFIAVALNYLLTMNVIGVLIYNQVNLVLKTIIQQSETDVDTTSTLFHQFVRTFFRGMNEVTIMEDISMDGEDLFKMSASPQLKVMDISQLKDRERDFLCHCLTETMSACIDSGRIFHTWLLQNAVKVAFERALEARRANLRALYDKHGSISFPLLRLGPLSFFWVTLRPPDIKTDIRAVKSKQQAGQDTEFSIVMDDTRRHRTGVTVEELFTALASVNIDILSRLPELFQEPRRAQVTKPDVSETRKEHQAVTWQPGASFHYLVDRLEAAGAMTETKGAKADKLSHPDDEFFAWMAKDMAEADRQQTAAYEHGERQIDVCEKNVAHIREQLAKADPVTQDKEMEIKKEMDAVEDQINLLRTFLEDFRYYEENMTSGLADTRVSTDHTTDEGTSVRNTDDLATDRTGSAGGLPASERFDRKGFSGELRETGGAPPKLPNRIETQI